jgi:hypothetical protein
MRLPRMTTRRWMIAVAIFAVGLATVAHFRGLVLRQRAAYHEKIEKLVTASVGDLAPAAMWPKAAQVRAKAAVRANAAIRDRHARLKEKYWRAAHHPWLPVEADPPEPATPFSLEDLHNIDVPSL